MLTETLRKLFRRDLLKLKQELELYSNEANIWLIDQNILNSAGNLALHLIGNLNTYIGAEFGKTGYIRDRPAEFSLKNIPRKQMLDDIDNTMEVVDTALSQLTQEQLDADYPQLINEETITTEYFLTHLAMHLSYHLGQVNYHRRLLDN